MLIPAQGQGQTVYNWMTKSGGSVSVFTTLTITAVPTSRTDGTALAPASIGGAHVYKNGATTPYATISGALTVGQKWSDTVAAVNGDKYTLGVFDTETPAIEGAASNVYVASVAAPALAPPGQASISGVTA
jgi:hypothetical protein